VPNSPMHSIKFGDTCTVPVTPDKRKADAVIYDANLKAIRKSELGVCLGYSRNSSATYEFLLENGQIVSRNHFDRVHVHPFD
jgi:hypothetical protein